MRFEESGCGIKYFTTNILCYFKNWKLFLFLWRFSRVHQRHHTHTESRRLVCFDSRCTRDQRLREHPEYGAPVTGITTAESSISNKLKSTKTKTPKKKKIKIKYENNALIESIKNVLKNICIWSYFDLTLML